MKTYLLALVSIAALLVGCGTVQRSTPVVTTQPVYALDESGQLVEVGMTNLVSEGEEYALDPRLTGAIATARAATTIGKSIPSPAQPLFALADYVVLGFGGLATAFAAWKSKRLTDSNAAHAGTQIVLDVAKAALAATTTAIENDSNAAALKEAARKAATANGSQDFLHEQVKNL